eukprot:3891038-Rhodomonas_salina.1
MSIHSASVCCRQSHKHSRSASTSSRFVTGLSQIFTRFVPGLVQNTIASRNLYLSGKSAKFYTTALSEVGK